MARTRVLPLLAAALAAALTGCVSTEGTPGFAVSPKSWNAGVERRGVEPAEAPNPMAATPAIEATALEIGELPPGCK